MPPGHGDRLPLHLHGSNLSVEEELENRVGWDIGLLDGAPFVAEDYMFGMDAFLQEGREAFGWHGCVALEQPPLAFPRSSGSVTAGSSGYCRA